MTDTTTNSRQPRRMAREPKATGPAADAGDDPAKATGAPKPEKTPSKLDRVKALLLVPTGASIAELVAATGWQQHSVREAMAGALKKRGLVITSDKVDGVRRYRASKAS